jgi:hypothetical protein
MSPKTTSRRAKKLENSSRAEKPAATAGEDPIETFVPDPVVAKEFHVTLMSLFRWDADPNLGFPRKVTIRHRNFRVRSEIEAFKKSLIAKAITLRA